MIKSGLLRLFKTGLILNARITDWGKLLDEARTHQVLERVACFTRIAPAGLVPSEVRLYLDKVYSQNLMKNLWIIEETENLLASMNENGIQCMVLKGVPLAEKLYDDPGARKSDDIDLLVKEDQLPEAVDVLIRKGYRYYDRGQDMLLWSRGPLTHHIRMEKPTVLGICNVEIHFHLTDTAEKQIIISEFWERSRAVIIGKTAKYELTSSDLLLYLCIHSAKHGFNTIKDILDIADILKAEGSGIDWPGFIRTVRRYGLSFRVYSSLNYAVSLLGAPVPENILKELRPYGPLRWVLKSECLPEQLPAGLKPVTLLLLNYEGIRLYLLDIWQRLFPPLAKLRLICNIYCLEAPAGIWRYYPKRWWRMLKIAFAYFIPEVKVNINKYFRGA